MARKFLWDDFGSHRYTIQANLDLSHEVLSPRCPIMSSWRYSTSIWIGVDGRTLSLLLAGDAFQCIKIYGIRWYMCAAAGDASSLLHLDA